jgi:polysaccharide biosynthesis transport protein
LALGRQKLQRESPRAVTNPPSLIPSFVPPTPGAEPLPDSPITPFQAWRILRKHWATALAVALAVSLSVTFYTLGQTKIYRTNATVQFDPTPPRPLGKGVETVVDMGAGDYWNNREYYETQYKVIQSMRLATATVKQLGLNNDASFLRNLPPGSHPGPFETTPEDAAEVLRGRLGVEPVKESRLAIVRYDDADPQRAQKVLSTLLDLYIEHNMDDALDSTNSAVEWLRSQLDKLKNDLESNEMALHDYKLNKNILSVQYDDQSNMLREEIKQINDTLTGVHTKRVELTARRNELMKVSDEDPSILPATELLQSSVLSQLRQNFVQAVRDRDGLLGSGKGTNHPEVLSASARVDASRSALLSEVKNIKGAVERDLAVVNAQAAGLSGLFEKAKTQALDLNLLEIEYNRLKRSKENTEKLYELVLERTKESDLTRMLRVNNLRILDRPLAPKTPVRPRVPINIAIGIIVGLLLGASAAVGRALMDRTIKTPDDVDRELGLPFLGLVPEIDDGAGKPSYYGRRKRSRHLKNTGTQELMVHEHPSSGIAEASRAIRTNLMFSSPDHPYKTLLVTSAGPSEGKTTVACCIAIAMAQAGQKVCIIDCDLRRPRLHRIFGKSSDVGVTTSLLAGDLNEGALPTDVPNLSVIPAGPLPPNPAEIVQSDRFRVALARLGERFDRIVIDSPPLIPVTDATILSTIVDGTVVVIKGFVTKKDFARQAVRSLQDVGAKVAGVILNAVNLDRHEYKYYYYYYKRDNYYSADRHGHGHGHTASADPPPDASAMPPN